MSKRIFVDEGKSERMSQWAFALAEMKIIKSHLAAVNRSHGDSSYDKHYMEEINLRELLDECLEEVMTEVYGKVIK